jgi:hypothetical protein
VRWRLLRRPRPGSGEDAIPPEVEVEAGPWGRARRRPPSEVEVEVEPWGRARRSPSSEVEVEVEAEPWGRARRSPSSEAEAGAEPCGRARRSPSSEAEAGAEPWGRARRRLLLRPRPKVGRGETQLQSASPWRVAQQSERGRRRWFPVRSISGRVK